MATLPVETTSRPGLNPTYASAAGGGDEFVNTGIEMVIIKNDDASSKTATFVTQKTIDGLAVADQAVTVPAGESRICGPYRPDYYNDGNGKVQITYSAVTNLKVNVFKPGAT